MKKLMVALLLGGTAMAGMAPEAKALGCVTGAIMGGIAGHMAGHGAMGAAGGCAAGHMVAKHRRSRQMQDGAAAVNGTYQGRDPSYRPGQGGYQDGTNSYQGGNGSRY